MAQTDFTIADVLAWARTKPADEGFSYFDNENCALCQFLRETGRSDEPFVLGNYYLDGDSSHDIGEPLASILSRVPSTFGDLAERLAIDAEQVSA